MGSSDDAPPPARPPLSGRGTRLTAAMQGLTGAQPAAPAAAAPAAPTPAVIPPGSVIGGGTATSVTQALLGPSIIGGHVGKDFEIEANGQVVTGGGAALMGGGGS